MSRSSELALDEFHRKKVEAVGFLNGVERDDVRVVERCNGAGFALEACEPLGIARHVGGQYLESNFATQLRVRRAVHLAHAARANRGGDLVVDQCAADQMEPPRESWLLSADFFLDEQWADSTLAPRSAGMTRKSPRKLPGGFFHHRIVCA